MVGFAISINRGEINAGVNAGVVVVAIDNKNGMSLGGTDVNRGLRVSWGNFELSEGDELNIQPSLLTLNSPTVTEEKMDREQLMTEYLSLKLFLTEKGLLK